MGSVRVALEALYQNAPVALLAASFALVFLWAVLSQETSTKVPSLRDPIPYVFNTLQFIANNDRFMSRVTKILKNANLAKFYLGRTPVYLVSGTQNVQSVLGRTWADKIGNEGIMAQSILPVLYRMSPEEVKRFADDKSGRTRKPPADLAAPERRYWSGFEHVHSDYLSRPIHFKPIIDKFCQHFSKALESVGDQWTTMSVVNFCKHEVTESAIAALFGPNMFKLNPEFLDAFWEFDENVFSLTLGFHWWVNSRPYKAMERYHGMIQNYLDVALKNFDWLGTEADTYWEPLFGARICLEVTKWFRDGFQDKVAAGALGTLLFAQNSNSIPVTMWLIMEIVKDSSLITAVREEITIAWETDESGVKILNTQKLTSLPLIQSIWTEVLRLHMNFNLIRNVKEPINMEGVTIGRGSMLQVPMLTAHLDEAVWGAQEHSASEFWGERHVKYVEETDASGNHMLKRVFSTAGRPSSFFPFGGGLEICPGRHYAKHEILATVALLISDYDIEFGDWRNLNGTPSDRPARNDKRYCGAGAQPPDRDMNIRIRRLQ